jgi:hypothetical protein
MQTIRHKRGDTFSATVTLLQADGTTPIDLTGFTVTAEVEGAALTGPFEQALTVTVEDEQAGQITLSATATDTAAWPITEARRRLLCDVKRVQGATVLRSPTFEIVVEKEITD